MALRLVLLAGAVLLSLSCSSRTGRGREAGADGDVGLAVSDVGPGNDADKDARDDSGDGLSPTETADAGARVCVPDESGCWQGILARCAADGSAMLPREACPPGEVCVDGRCERNQAYVLLVVDNLSMGDWTPATFNGSYTDPGLLTEVYEEARALDPDCAADYVQTAVGHGLMNTTGCPSDGSGLPYRPIDVAKWWVRRIVERLRDVPGVSIGLVHQQQFEGQPTPAVPWECGDEAYLDLCCDVQAECATLGYLGDPSGDVRANPWECGYLPGLLEVLEAPHDYYYEAPIPDGEDSPLSQHLGLILSSHPTRDFDDLLRWVDQREELRPTGTGCDEDADCEPGLCRNGACWTHDNPEVVARADCAQIYNQSPGEDVKDHWAWLVLHYIQHFLQAEGRSCAKDDDCVVPGARCGADERCHDPARSCRRLHVIWLSEFLRDYYWHSGDTRAQWIARYLHFGDHCRDDDDCMSGARCGDPLDDVDSSCLKNYGVCYTDDVPEWLRDTLTQLPSMSDTGVVPHCRIFPGARTGLSYEEQPAPYPFDRSGERFQATVHSILVGHGLLGGALDGRLSIQQAISTAVMGGGKWVAPCPPNPDSWRGIAYGAWQVFDDCDWERQFDELIDAILDDLDNHVCTGRAGATHPVWAAQQPSR